MSEKVDYWAPSEKCWSLKERGLIIPKGQGLSPARSALIKKMEEYDPDGKKSHEITRKYRENRKKLD